MPGESLRIIDVEVKISRADLFQSTPGINAGRIEGVKAVEAVANVSIHARH